MFGICGVSGILSRCELRRKDAVATIRATCSEGGEDPKAGWVPHLPAHVHNFADSEQRGGEGGTGAPTSCEQSYHAGSLRSGGYAEQKAGTKQTCSDGAQQGRSTGLTGPNWTMIEIANSLQALEKNGGDDETRTRDLCRDSPARIGFTTTYKHAGTAKVRGSRARHRILWVGLWVENLPTALSAVLHLHCSTSGGMYSLRPTFRRSGSYSLTDCVADFPEEDFWPVERFTFR
jgi:hypothetical protein